MRFAKGHGTENDFVILPDPDGELDLDAATVAALCDRRAGLGADGVLRVVRTKALDEPLTGEAATAQRCEWFMDYRNADGSVAEMCGNGVRVFAHYLRASGLESRDEFVVGSPAGPRPVVLHHSDATTADVTVEMGKANQSGTGTAVVGGRRFTGLAVDVGNPHLACVDPELTEDALAALDVAAPVQFDTEQFPDGVNIEVLTPPVDSVVSMRVHERGVGETRSCGTGTVAATVAALRHLGADTGTMRVRVPGGTVTVTVTETTSHLRGPSVLVARGDISADWWAAQRDGMAGPAGALIEVHEQ